MRDILTAGQWRAIAGMSTVILGLHALGFFILIALVEPAPHHLGAAGVIAGGTGTTAYMLGLRHAIDADHITAIDNTTRKLMSEGKRPVSVGFFFSLGHSTIVFVLALLLSVGVKTLGGQVKDRTSQLHGVTGLIGTGVSGAFLYIVGALNVVILFGVIRTFRAMRSGDRAEDELAPELDICGPMSRLLRRFFRTVNKPWHMYPIGVLFGLGFDTATEVALLFLTAGAVGTGLPFYTIMCLPILFAAGMSLLDTIDGVGMNFAYGWALSKPIGRVYYNIAVTCLSVAVALLVGTIELGGIMARHVGAQGPFWRWMENVDLNTLGFVIAGMFIATWVVSAAIWRLARIERRWSTRARSAPEDLIHGLRKPARGD